MQESVPTFGMCALRGSSNEVGDTEARKRTRSVAIEISDAQINAPVYELSGLMEEEIGMV